MFGAFCPLPLRLSVDPQTGVTAGQYCRLAADQLAMRRSRSVARLTFTQANPPVLLAYVGINGAGSANSPTLARIATGVTRITFPTYYDNTGRVHALDLKAARWCVEGTTARLVSVTVYGNVADVEVSTLAGWGNYVDATISLTFDGCWETTTLEDYGATPDKQEVEQELVPYAWTWYQEFEGMLGSGFTTARTGYVHAHKLALARLFGAGLQRAIERLACNFNPATSDDMLNTWAQVFSLQVGPSTPRWEVRQDCATRMRLLSGVTREAIDDVVGTVLGDLLVAVHRNVDNDLSDPPSPTYWPGGDPGDPSFGLCGYQWSSARSFVWAEVKLPTSMLESEFHRLVNIRLFRLLDIALPAFATFGWATSSGFVLGYSRLGYDAL